MKAGLEIQLRQIEKQLDKQLSDLLLTKHYVFTEQEAKKIIRDKALQVYELGIGYVCDFFGIPSFVAAEDFAAVGKITDDVYRTWYYGGRLDSALVALTSVTLAKSVKSKAAQIALAHPYLQKHTAAIMRMKTIMKTLDSPLDDYEPLRPNLVLEWQTEQDALVCPICEELEGQQWELDDTSALTPVIDSHPNCRCRIQIVNLDEDTADLG